jgi:predicted  nucleic acid-binding Zn ribbon protein
MTEGYIDEETEEMVVQTDGFLRVEKRNTIEIYYTKHTSGKTGSLKSVLCRKCENNLMFDEETKDYYCVVCDT